MGIEHAKNISKYKIVVAAVWGTYLKIKGILRERGLVEFENFIWSLAFNKKIVVMNMNCYMWNRKIFNT